MAGLGGLSGIASGIDTGAIVEQLMTLERKGRDRMDVRQAQLTARQTGFTTVQDKLLSLRVATMGLRDLGAWADKQAVESSDAKVGVERTSGAGPGGYTVNVTALARAEQRSYAFTKQDAASQLDVGGVKVDLAAGATVDDAVSAINGATGSKVYATKVDDKLVLSARTTGTSSAFTATGAALSGESVRAGTNAKYSIDDGPEVESQTNQVSNAIAGVRLTFKGVTAAPAAVVVSTPTLDKDGIKKNVEAFVTAYNDLIKTTSGLLDEKPVKGGATDKDSAKQGALYADSSLSQMLSRLRFSVADTVKGAEGAMDELRELGVSTGKATGGASSPDAKTGLLQLDDAVLTGALENPQAVRRMLGGLSGVEGFAQRLENVVKTYTGVNGTVTGRVKEADTQLVALQQQMKAEDDRLATREARLKAQFAAMESALSNAQSQGAWLNAQLGVK